MSTPGELRDGECYLGNYILDRLAQLSVRKLMGVPGDFNLTFLDLVEDHKDVEWVGCANELNASYAADGYARVKQVQLNAEDHKTAEGETTQGGVKGVGALLTTYGVGELSAANGIAGAYSERVPVIHVVGVPSTKIQKDPKSPILHHTLADGHYDAYQLAAKPFTAGQVFLTSAKDAGEKVDELLKKALLTARPVYLTLPTDLVFSPVSSEPLKTLLRPPTTSVNESVLPSGKKLSETAKDTVEFIVAEITRLWDAAKNPVLLVDACVIRYGVQHLVEDLVKATGVKYFSTPMGKGVLPETAESGFGGVYVGEISDPEVKEAFEKADLTILCGSLKSDFNTGEFSYKLDERETIELHSDHTIVQYAHYPKSSFHSLLPALATALKPKATPSPPPSSGLTRSIPPGPSNEMITQAAFWPLWGSFLRENDVVITETGTSSFGIVDVKLPTGGISVSQVLYGSIGWATGATLGCLEAALEAPDGKQRRTILFTGDGSLQLTVQEIGTMVRRGLKPIIVVLNNDGYVIERLIHGETRKYNDIGGWRWQALLELFNAAEGTRGELEEILASEELKDPACIQLVEVHLERMDAPRALVAQAKMSAQLNSA